MGYLLKCITYNFLAQWIIAAVSEVAAGFCSQKEFKNSYVASPIFDASFFGAVKHIESAISRINKCFFSA